MKPRLFLIHGGRDHGERIAEREAARRAHLRAIRSRRERHTFADLRVQQADETLAQRLEAA